MNKTIMFLLIIAGFAMAQFSQNNEWYEIRLDNVEDFGAQGGADLNLNVGEGFVLSWDHQGFPDTTGVWLLNVGGTWIVRVNNEPAIWQNNRASKFIDTGNVNGEALPPGFYQARIRTWGKKIIDGQLQDWATPYTESVFFFSVAPPDLPNGTGISSAP